MFQFTRPRGARHSLAGGVFTGLEHVSIHAPTGGATPCWRSTRLRTRFQFTRPRGARLYRGKFPGVAEDVSIHAPTGGATILLRDKLGADWFQFTRPRGARHRFEVRLRGLEEFQFTRPRGARRIPLSPPPNPLEFQFTRPRGARRRQVARIRRGRSFNSRAHGGRDRGDACQSR